jgi:hypothetical protein
MSSSSAVESIVETIDAAIESGDVSGITDSTMQQLMGAAARLYAARVEQGGFVPVTAPGALNATQGMIVTTALLRAVNVQLFELGLWQSWAK